MVPAPLAEEAKPRPPAPLVEPPREEDAARERLYRESVEAKAVARALRTRLSDERTALAASLAAAEGREREVIEIDPATLQLALGRVDLKTDLSGGQYSGQVMIDGYAGERSMSETAAAITIRILAGEDPMKTLAIRDGLRAVVGALATAEDVDMQYRYYGTVATRLASASFFGRWRASMSPLCQKAQVSSGPDAGSWDPEDRESRFHATALMTLTLIECAR